MSEEIIAFHGGGFGIATRGRSGAAPAPVLVLLNAGLMPRSGAFRLHVELARALAADGITTVRCELPGIGDGGTGDAPWPDHHRHMLDRICEHTGCASMAVGGVCSAADDAWRLAQVDARVDALLMVDPFAVGGLWLQWGRLGLLRYRSWKQRLHALRHLWRRNADSGPSDGDLRNWPDPRRARVEMAALRQRGARMLMLHTGGSASYFLHPRQFQATWGCAPDGVQVRFDHWRDADHLLFRPQDRERLAQVVGHWMRPAREAAA